MAQSLFYRVGNTDCSKLLDNPDLPPEMMMEILNREAELVKMANEKDTEIRQQENEIEDKVNKKDSEKRERVKLETCRRYQLCFDNCSRN